MPTSAHSRYFVRASDVKPYSPANHTGTANRRLIGAENVGARHVEMVLGVMEPGRGALPHSHPGIEQVCYLLEGRARAEVGGEICELDPGDCCFFPPDMPHVFTAVGDRPAKVLVIYSPPYGEDTNKARR
ncbi:MAG TPA: cupin domain-containing protein [Burkholderiales bacterium]|nr:cupin domain-containing protein [Burkholderiales bacterium]